MPRNQPTIYCSFCGRGHYEVERLISGPAVYICNTCVDECVKIIQEELLIQMTPECIGMDDFVFTRVPIL